MTSVPALLERLLHRHAVWRGGIPALPDETTVPSGFASLDRALPGGGWPTGALTEIHATVPGTGEMQLMLPALAALSAMERPHLQLWLAPPHTPFAPALERANIDLRALVLVRTGTRQALLWAAEQALRSGACSALLAWVPEIRYVELKRLAVAAAQGASLAVLFRPPGALQEASPACLRLQLEPCTAGLQVHFLKRRGAPRAVPLTLPVDRLVHALAGPALSALRPRDPVARACLA